MVSGGAGSGKSTVIESVEEWVNYILSGLECGESGHNTDQPLLVIIEWNSGIFWNFLIKVMEF